MPAESPGRCDHLSTLVARKLDVNDPAPYPGEEQMTSYMMSQIELKYGFANLRRYQAAMTTVQEHFESQGEKLVLSTTTRVGTLFEVLSITAANSLALSWSHVAPDDIRVCVAADGIMQIDDIDDA